MNVCVNCEQPQSDHIPAYRRTLVNDLGNPTSIQCHQFTTPTSRELIRVKVLRGPLTAVQTPYQDLELTHSEAVALWGLLGRLLSNGPGDQVSRCRVWRRVQPHTNIEDELQYEYKERA
jgi:hypothetical protein